MNPGRTMMKSLTAAAAALLRLALPATAAAQTPGQKDAMPDGLRSLVQAERDFSRMSREKGMKEAFIANAADDGVVFRHAAVNAKEVWRETNPAPTALLTWHPVFADISRAGDLGYTTGPYELRPNPSDRKPTGTGHYFTVWRRQADGSWKFALDMGVRHDPPAEPLSVLDYPPPRAGRVSRQRPETALELLLAAEGDLARRAVRAGDAAALMSHAAPSLRLYRQGRTSLVGLDAARAFLSGVRDVSVWKVVGSGVSASGDLGYVYGSYETRPDQSAGKSAEAGNYVRVWKRAPGGPWLVVLDITNPVPPPGR